MVSPHAPSTLGTKPAKGKLIGWPYRRGELTLHSWQRRSVLGVDPGLCRCNCPAGTKERVTGRISGGSATTTEAVLQATQHCQPAHQKSGGMAIQECGLETVQRGGCEGW